MDESEFNRRRKALLNGLVEAFGAAIDERPGFKIDGFLRTDSGQFQFNNLTCVYKDLFSGLPNTNILDIWFGPKSTRNDERGELQLAADVERSVWIRQQPPLRFDNDQLAKFCVERLREIAAQH